MWLGGQGRQGRQGGQARAGKFLIVMVVDAKTKPEQAEPRALASYHHSIFSSRHISQAPTPHCPF